MGPVHCVNGRPVNKPKRDWVYIFVAFWCFLVLVASIVAAIGGLTYNGYYWAIAMMPILVFWWRDNRRSTDVKSDVSDLLRRVRSLERKLNTEGNRIINTKAESTGALVRTREENQ